jgi:hypothetical protein
MRDIRLKFTSPDSGLHQNTSPWSSTSFVDMIATVQASGAEGLWSFEIEGYSTTGQRVGCIAERIGWLDVASQPKLKGEWNISLKDPFSNSLF